MLNRVDVRRVRDERTGDAEIGHRRDRARRERELRPIAMGGRRAEQHDAAEDHLQRRRAKRVVAELVALGERACR